MSEEGSWEVVQQAYRRFPVKGHRRGKREFDYRNACGTYAIKCPVIETNHSIENLTLDIHCLTDDGNGMEASFDFGVLAGPMLVTGSRAKLGKMVEAVRPRNQVAEESQTDVQDTGVRLMAKDVENGSDGDSAASDRVEADLDYLGGSDHNLLQHDTTLTVDEDHRTTSKPPTSERAFEKNTFRCPKFWFQWRGLDKKHDSIVQDPHNLNKGFLEFTNNACKSFKGTFTSDLLGTNVAIQGYKIRPGFSTCPYAWNEFE